MTDHVSRDAAVDAALTLRRELLEATPTEPVSPDEIAGRVLADPVESPRDDPATDRSTMDGYAVATADGYPLAVGREEVYPEDAQPPMEHGEAVPVATGGAIPARADAVLKREDVTVDDGRLEGPTVDPGANVYRRGSNLVAGETLFTAGERLLPKDAVLLDDLGVAGVQVRERWSVGVLATGTEIHEGTAPDRDSHMLVGLARSWGHDATHEGSVPDDPDALVDRLAALAEAHDVLFTSGGTSVGSRDHVGDALAALGEVRVGAVAISPGNSTSLARIPAATESDRPQAAVVSVPGRPVAAHAAAVLFARPLLTGRRDLPAVEATAGVDVRLGPPGECVVPVHLRDGEARPVNPDRGSEADTYTYRPSILSSFTRATRADGFLLVEGPVDAGETVRVVPFAGVERS